MVAIRSLRDSPNGSIIAVELAQQFEAADKWLRPFELKKN